MAPPRASAHYPGAVPIALPAHSSHHANHHVNASRSTLAPPSLSVSTHAPVTWGSNSIPPLSLRTARFAKPRALPCTEQDAWITTRPRSIAGDVGHPRHSSLTPLSQQVSSSPACDMDSRKL